MYGKSLWTGIEVEGRLSGVKTLFIRDLVNGNIGVENYSTYPHYYFTIEYMKKAVKQDEYLNIIHKILDTSNAAVTIEADSTSLENVPTSIFNLCHIIYRVQDRALQVLKPTDTVSFDAGWYR